MVRPFAYIPAAVAPPVLLTTPTEILLGSILDLLNEIKVDLDAMTPLGRVLTVTIDVVGTTMAPISFSPGFFSLKLSNDGPETVQYRVPGSSPQAWIDILPVEEDEVRFATGVISSLALQVVTPGTAHVRCRGTY